MMKRFHSAILVAAVILLSGCAHSFVRPAPDAVKVGHSSREDVIKVAGEPRATNENVQINGETIQTVTYFHLGGAKFWGMIVPQRTLTYSFFNNILIGEEFNSSFSEDTTNFEAEKVEGIVKGKSTKDDVIAALGKPSGNLLYPIVKDKNNKGIAYEYTVTRHAGIFSPTNSFLIVISFDANNVVSDISYKRNNVEQIKG